ncbi:MAG: sigma-70 family RNA polymerase sigma factor [Deltaproteobacteria bacterium]|jgi:RNA polymerase sigma factor (sigma-70 family)|nr:sigma-70 family RNA polymerase sigma factor [Deltaproteobacteria bacterium]
MEQAMPDGNKFLAAIESCQGRLKAFIAKRVPFSEVDDVFQEIVHNLIRADSLNGPIDLVAAWLFRAARNEIVDRYRKKREVLLLDDPDVRLPDEFSEISQVMLSAPLDPEEAYLRSLFWQELEEALGGLPKEQREAFVRTEFMGASFKELSAETGIPVNTLLSRKHKAVLALRERLLELYELIVCG